MAGIVLLRVPQQPKRDPGSQARKRWKPASFRTFRPLTPPTRAVTNRALFRQAVSFF